jgi:putative ABC transport system permease protein
MNSWTYTLRELRRRPARTLLTILGVAIGVAVLSAAAVAIRGARLAYRELYERVAGRDCLEVVAPGQAGFDPGAAGRLASVPGVRAAVPRIVANAAVVAAGGASPALVVAAGPPGQGALLDTAYARAHGCAVGTPLRLWTPGGLVELPLAGLFEAEGPAAFTGVALVRLPLATAQRLFGLPGQVNSVQLLLADGADPGTVRPAVEGVLSGGLMIQETGQRGALARSTLFAAEQGLTCLGLVAAVAAAFIVLNTFLLNLAERRGEAATLRVLGATRAQVLALLLGESALLGMTGGVLGAFAGLGLALALREAMQQFLGVGLPSFTPGAGHFLFTALLGPALTLSASCLSALRSSREDPLAALLRRGKQDAVRGPGWVPPAGVGLCVTAALLECLIWQGRLPGPTGRALLAPGVALLLAGCVLAVPLLASPLLRVCGLVLGPVLGTEGRLALRQVTRQRTRLTLTAGVLFVAIAAAVGVGHCLLNTLRDLGDWYHRTIVADFIVSGSAGDTSFLLSAPLPAALAGELGGLAGVARVDLIAFAPVAAGGQPVLALARTFAADLPLPLDLREGEPGAVRRGLLDGETVLGAALARHLGLHAGDRIPLATAAGPRSVRVAGTAVEYAAGGHALYLEWVAARKLLALPGVHVFLVTARPEERAAASQALQSYCRGHALLLQSNDELRTAIDGLLARVVGALWALMAVIFIVAALGVTNTLALNVREQSRELGILRAVGATRQQVGRFVLWQALLTGVVGLLPGAVLGVTLGALINGAAGAVTGQQAAFAVELPLTVGCLALSLVIIAAAALLPASRAARLAVVDALRG